MAAWRTNLTRCTAGLLLASAAWLSALAEPAAKKPAPADAVLAEPPIEPEHRDHWAYRPLARVAPPDIANDSFSRSPLDRFIVNNLAARQLRPSPPADRVALLRRLSFDLIGLPPRPDEIDRVVADPSPDAFERQVDRLIGQHHFGERMAQPWLDLARFAETDGFEHDLIRPEAWRYREWVVRAINADLPYDQFVAAQIDGDGGTSVVAKNSAATNSADDDAAGFCLAGPDMPDINSQDERRHNVLNELTSTVGSVFLGLQVGCAQCHNHKYDPISQADFYRLRAFFEPAIRFEKDKTMSMMSSAPASAAKTTKPAKAKPNQLKPNQLKSTQPPATFVALRGDFRRPGPRVVPAYPRIVNARDERPSSDESSAAIPLASARHDLAGWMTRADHPLTSRVMANRIWQHHFGTGLSREVSDFGVMGDEPSNPDLLDFLAGEFIRREWSVKQLRRTIVTSAAYRQSTRRIDSSWSNEQTAQARTAWARGQELDPDNRLLWAFPRQRLDGEIIRDAILFAAGDLNLQRGGRGIMAPLPPEVAATMLKNQWQVDRDASQHVRRSIYLFARRNLRFPLFEAFDRPDAQATCPQRNRSTTAPQELVRINSELTHSAAARLALRAIREIEDDLAPGIDRGGVRGIVAHCFRLTLSRWPTDQERADAEAMVTETTKRTESFRSAVADLCLALFTSNEFLYVD